MLNRLNNALGTIEGLSNIISSQDKEALRNRLISALKQLTPVPAGEMTVEEVNDLKTIVIINSLLSDCNFNLQIRQTKTGDFWAETILKIYNKHYDFSVVKTKECDQCGDLYPEDLDSNGICKECESKIECKRIEKERLV